MHLVFTRVFMSVFMGVRLIQIGGERDSLCAVQASIESLSVPALKAYLKDRAVSYAGCIEKADLVKRAEEASHRTARTGPDPCRSNSAKRSIKCSNASRRGHAQEA